MKSHHIGAGMEKSQKVVDDEFMKRLKKEGRTAQRRPVQLFALLVADCFFDDLDTKLRALASEVIGRIFQVGKESCHGLL